MLNYPELLKEVQGRIRQAQIRATMSANAEMLMLYWDVGKMVASRQNEEGWGTSVIPRLAKDIKNDMSEVKGFSARNISRMLNFYKEYSTLPDYLHDLFHASHINDSILPTPLAKLPEAAVIVPTPVAQIPDSDGELRKMLISYVFRLPWAHNVALIGIKDWPTRLWYMEHAFEQGWSHDWLVAQIKSRAHERQARAVTNFADRLPLPSSALAQDALKDPYIFDFLTLEEPYHEKEIEAALVANVEKFLLELGTGFAFMGRQYHLDVGEHDFYIDLLFYHTRLHCYVVIELKRGAFKPEYAGKVNFYCSVVDDCLKQEGDNPTIGLILCQTKDRVVAEYTLKGTQKPIGISEYELTRFLPDDLQSLLPSIASIEERMDEMSKNSE